MPYFLLYQNFLFTKKHNSHTNQKNKSSPCAPPNLSLTVPSQLINKWIFKINVSARSAARNCSRYEIVPSKVWNCSRSAARNRKTNKEGIKKCSLDVPIFFPWAQVCRGEVTYQGVSSQMCGDFLLFLGFFFCWMDWDSLNGCFGSFYFVLQPYWWCFVTLRLSLWFGP